MSVSPPLNVRTIAFLSGSLKITASSAKLGIIKKDEHYEKTKKFYDCLLKLRERSKVDFDSDIFNYFIDRVTYADIQKILDLYCKRNGFDYSKLIDELIETNQGVLEGKVVGNINTYTDIVHYLGQGNFKREF